MCYIHILILTKAKIVKRRFTKRHGYCNVRAQIATQSASVRAARGLASVCPPSCLRWHAGGQRQEAGRLLGAVCAVDCGGSSMEPGPAHMFGMDEEGVMWRLFQDYLFASCYWHLAQQGDQEALWRGFFQGQHGSLGFYSPVCSPRTLLYTWIRLHSR